jgi:hypothetical protein
VRRPLQAIGGNFLVIRHYCFVDQFFAFRYRSGKATSWEVLSLRPLLGIATKYTRQCRITFNHE